MSVAPVTFGVVIYAIGSDDADTRAAQAELADMAACLEEAAIAAGDDRLPGRGADYFRSALPAEEDVDYWIVLGTARGLDLARTMAGGAAGPIPAATGREAQLRFEVQAGPDLGARLSWCTQGVEQGFASTEEALLSVKDLLAEFSNFRDAVGRSLVMTSGARPPEDGDIRTVVAQAIAAQVTELDESDLPLDVAVHLTADRLVREALTAGHVAKARVSEVTAFGAGNTAMLVATVHAQLAFVVKVDNSPDIVREAHLLRRMASDAMLPPTTRAAFPQVYAIDDSPPLYGYLMELIDGGEPLHLALRAQHPDSARLLTGLWAQVLEPAYRATLNSRLAHNLHEDYFGRVQTRLQRAADAGLLPAADCEIVLDDGDVAITVTDGWAAALEAASQRLDAVKPGFGMWVHGDPNPENALWTSTADETTYSFRLLDPKDWWIGDYIFDAAKLGHYAAVTAPVESGLVDVESPASDPTAPFTIGYDRAALGPGRQVADVLADRVGELADELGDSGGRERYHLAVAANLLSIAGPRAERAARTGEQIQADLAWVALAEGLRALAKAEAM